MRRPRHRSYFEIVWSQFRAHRTAFWSLWALAPLFGLAVAAPLLASNQPFVYWDEEAVLFPWFRALFALDEPVNYFFNMALVAIAPSLAVMLAVGWLRRRPKIALRRRIAWGASLYLAMTAALTATFALPPLRINQTYIARDFTAEERESSGVRHGIYPPLPFGPKEQDLHAVFQPPMFRKALEDRVKSNDAWPHLLGTDNTGRDVLVLMLYGARISMTVGFLAVGLYLSIGCLVGVFAGYFGGKTDMLISRVIEVVMLFPAFFLILTLVALIGPSIYIIMFVIGLTGWPGVARLIRAEVLKQRSLDYVAAAQACGASHVRIMLRHLLPNSLGPAFVLAPFGVAGAIMTEAGLSLLGFGVQPPTPSWGALLQLGSANYNYWWLVVTPSLAIFAIVTLFNLVGHGLRDAMDPKLRVSS